MPAPTSTPIGGHDASSANEASVGDDATTGDEDVTLADAASEASAWGPPDASCPRSGSFTCGTGDAGECDRATQFCQGTMVNGGFCQPLSGLATVLMDSGTCGSCPTCDCIPPAHNNDTCTCFMDNYGGLTVACSQGGCYGSPPTRLDRAPMRAIG